jgi:hypothetical protein
MPLVLARKRALMNGKERGLRRSPGGGRYPWAGVVLNRYNTVIAFLSREGGGVLSQTGVEYPLA